MISGTFIKAVWVKHSPYSYGVITVSAYHLTANGRHQKLTKLNGHLTHS
jgi:hypothetical protein